MKIVSARRPMRASVLLLALASIAPLSAQEPRTLSYGEPEDVGMSSSVLDAAIDLYHDAVERGDLVFRPDVTQRRSLRR